MIESGGFSDVEANKLLSAAGKPPIEELRGRIANGQDSLPVLLHAWRESVGGSTAEAARLLGIQRVDFSRLANGSRNLRSVKMVERVAGVLGLSGHEVLVSAGLEHSELAKKVTRSREGVPRLVSDLMKACNLDSLEKGDRSAAARLFGVSLPRLWKLLNDTATLSLQEVIRMSEVSGLGIGEVLERSGIQVDASVAPRLSGIKNIRYTNEPFSAVLKKYRKERGLIQRALVERCPGISPGMHMATRTNRIAQYECGARHPSLEIAVELADALEAPLDVFISAIAA
jgi:transcriptional regulator with XRE-family HTH domain